MLHELNIMQYSVRWLLFVIFMAHLSVSLGRVLNSNGILHTLRRAVGGRDFKSHPQTPYEYCITKAANKLIVRNFDGKEIAISAVPGGLAVQSVGFRSGVVNHPRHSSVCHGVFGVYDLPGGHYVAVIKDSQLCTDLGIGVRKVTKVELVKVPGKATSSERWNTTAVDEQQELAEALLRNTLRQHTFYMSVDKGYDLTRTYQSNVVGGVSQLPDERFFWNLNCAKPLLEQNCSDFVVPVINAWTAAANMAHNGEAYSYTLISRRGRRRQGPRFVL